MIGIGAQPNEIFHHEGTQDGKFGDHRIGETMLALLTFVLFVPSW